MQRSIPNILTIGRLVLTVVLFFLILYVPKTTHRTPLMDAAFAVFLLAGITDAIDGAIARKLGAATRFGRIMDPLADKVLVCGSFICFALIGEPKLFNLSEYTLAIIQWSVAGILIARELYVTILRHIAEARGVNFAATTSGKIKMFVQSFAIGAVLIKIGYVPTAAWGYWFITVVFILMLASTVVSGIRATQRSSWKQVATIETINR
jgi:CDP-diacylglycerol---glycerol-3-phosphate 3-phosphatidyltransferase